MEAVCKYPITQYLSLNDYVLDFHTPKQAIPALETAVLTSYDLGPHTLRRRPAWDLVLSVASMTTSSLHDSAWNRHTRERRTNWIW